MGTIGTFRTGNSAHNFTPCGTRRCPKPLTAFAKSGASLARKAFREGNSRTMLAPVLPWLAFLASDVGQQIGVYVARFCSRNEASGWGPNRTASMKIDGYRPGFGRRIKHQPLICTRQCGGKLLGTTGHFNLGGLCLLAPTEQPQHTKPRLGVAA